MPKVSVSRDGSKIVFGSNFGLQKILGYPSEYSDAYMIDLGAPASTNSNSGPPASGPPAPPSTPPAGPAPSPTIPTTPTGAATRFEQTSAGFSGDWYDNGLASHSGSSAKLTATEGARATFPFKGTGAKWIAYRDE